MRLGLSYWRKDSSPQRSAAKRAASVASTMSSENTHITEVLSALVHEATSNVELDVSLPAMRQLMLC